MREDVTVSHYDPTNSVTLHASREFVPLHKIEIKSDHVLLLDTYFEIIIFQGKVMCL
jgi:hypothetical protein